MTTRFSIGCIGVSLLLASLLGCGANRMEQYNDFAIRCAKAGLWREATYRWEQVLTLSPENAPVLNNLGVAYEALGETDKALDVYQQAIAADPANQVYLANRQRCLNQRAADAQSPPQNFGTEDAEPE